MCVHCILSFNLRKHYLSCHHQPWRLSKLRVSWPDYECVGVEANHPPTHSQWDITESKFENMCVMRFEGTPSFCATVARKQLVFECNQHLHIIQAKEQPIHTCSLKRVATVCLNGCVPIRFVCKDMFYMNSHQT